MKEYFITDDGTVIVCSKIQAIYFDDNTCYADDTHPIMAQLEGCGFELCAVTEQEAGVKIGQLLLDIFEEDLPGYPTHGGKPPGGPLEG